MMTKLVTAPTIEPLTVAQVREHLRNPERTDNDAELQEFVKVAREMVEHKLQRALVTQTWDLILDSFPPYLDSRGNAYSDSYYITLPYPPIQSVTSIIYYDSDNASQTLATTEYVVDTVGGTVRLAPDKSWPSVYGRHDAITIRYVAGWTSPEAIPALIKAYMRLLIEAMDKNRGLLQERETTLTPFAERLLDPYRAVGV